ncbi:MAG: hypothetical protein Q8Q47_02550 [Ignavibacteriaceae bacterium]|nr:hypothetical protein [Ignavibacteriaceae bacterium]
MKELYIKLIELRTALKTFSNLSDSTRELGIASTLSNFSEFVKDNYKQYDIDMLKQTAVTIWLSSHPQKLREELLEDLNSKLINITDENLEQNIYPVLSIALMIEPIFKDVVFNSELMEKIKVFRKEYDDLKNNQSQNLSELVNLIHEFYTALLQHIEFNGITLGQIELAASEVVNADYNSIDLSNHLLMLEGDFSEYRKTIFLIQAFTVVSAIKNLNSTLKEH